MEKRILKELDTAKLKNMSTRVVPGRSRGWISLALHLKKKKRKRKKPLNVEYILQENAISVFYFKMSYFFNL